MLRCRGRFLIALMYETLSLPTETASSEVAIVAQT